MNNMKLSIYVNQFDETMTHIEVIEHLEGKLADAERVIKKAAQGAIMGHADNLQEIGKLAHEYLDKRDK